MLSYFLVTQTCSSNIRLYTEFHFTQCLLLVSGPESIFSLLRRKKIFSWVRLSSNDSINAPLIKRI
uniref:Uncharacterized protein n=1 Tax=Lepeophtheirus salmonis TaxID=72036 RepID=A0A0K2TN52_LEPSM